MPLRVRLAADNLSSLVSVNRPVRLNFHLGQKPSFCTQDILRVRLRASVVWHPVDAIAKKVLQSGTESLIGEQIEIYDRYILPRVEPVCRRCHNVIPDSELIGSYENGGLCSWDAKMEANDG
jgi:hypothetical protein